MNIQHQNTINKTGKIIDNERLTHNQSYKWGSEMSVNSRTMKEFWMPCIYGTCLKWLINWTIIARKKYPNKQIMVSKIDFKSAFWHCNLSSATAIQCCTKLPFKDLILLYLHLTFRGSPCLNKWWVFSKPICNLATAILHDNSWDPTELHSPTQNLVSLPRTIGATYPLAYKKINRGHQSKSKGNPQYIHWQHDPPHPGHSRNRQSSKMHRGRAPCNPCNRPTPTPKWTNPKRKDEGKK